MNQTPPPGLRGARLTRAQKAARVLELALRSADALLAKSDPEAAAVILERYLKAHPANAAVLGRLGRIRLSQGRPDEAAPLLEQALAHIHRN